MIVPPCDITSTALPLLKLGENLLAVAGWTVGPPTFPASSDLVLVPQLTIDVQPIGGLGAGLVAEAVGTGSFEIINNTPYGVLVWPTTTDTSITVQLFSTKWVEAEQTGQSERRQGVSCTSVTTERTRTWIEDRMLKANLIGELP